MSRSSVGMATPTIRCETRFHPPSVAVDFRGEKLGAHRKHRCGVVQPSEPMPIGSPASRKLLLTMVVFVVLLDVVAIGSYYAFGLAQRPNLVRMAFTVIWAMITL